MSSDADQAEESTPTHPGSPAAGVAVGKAVCVWNYYLQAWSGGFEVAEALALGYRLRRTSDGQVVDHVFSAEEVMVERRRQQVPGIEGTSLDRRSAGEDAPDR